MDTIEINYSDLDQMREIMDTYGDSKYMLKGVNQDGESQGISTCHDNIVVSTFQDNVWTRVNTFWYDGTVEETFDGRWK